MPRVAAIRLWRGGLVATSRRYTLLSHGLVLAIGILPLCGSCAAPPAPVADPPALLRIGIAFPTASANTAIGASVVAWRIAGGRLLQIDRNGRYVSDLAQAWESSSDGLTHTFRLEPNARFPDGTFLTPELVKAYFTQYLGSPELTDPFPLIRDVVGVDTGPATVTIRLRRPSRLLLDSLDFPIIRESGGRQMGAGPFYVESEDPELTTLRANRYYHGGAPDIDAIQLHRFDTVRAAWSAMMRDEVDLLYQVPNDTREFLERETGVRMFPVVGNTLFTLVFNTRRPALESPAVRAALSRAVDGQQIVDLALRRHGRAAEGFLWPDHWARSFEAPVHAYEPLVAFNALNPMGRPSRRTAPRARLSFRCLVPAGLAPHDRIAIVLQKQLFDVGVDLEIESVPPRDVIRRLTTGDYDAVLLDLNIGPSLARVFTYWHSSNSAFLATTGYNAADDALASLRSARTDRELQIAVDAVQRAFHRDPPAIFLAWPETTRAVSDRFEIPDTQQDVIASVSRWRRVIQTSGSS